jgi:hypothetical protein
MKFTFVINLKASKQIGLTIPPEVVGAGNEDYSIGERHEA